MDALRDTYECRQLDTLIHSTRITSRRTRTSSYSVVKWV